MKSLFGSVRILILTCALLIGFCLPSVVNANVGTVNRCFDSESSTVVSSAQRRRRRYRRPVRARTAPAGATARCRDGTYSFSQNRRGTCSHHGGVAEWLR